MQYNSRQTIQDVPRTFSLFSSFLLVTLPALAQFRASIQGGCDRSQRCNRSWRDGDV